MTPVQLWLPTFFGGIARPESRRDMQRMFKARTSERVMWSVPGWTGPKCWTQQGLGVSCFNGESLERVRILNVGDSGVVVGPAAASFPNLSVNGLLDAWLNDAFVRVVQKNPDEKIHVMIPHPVVSGVAHREVELPITSVHHFPFTHFDNDDKHVYSQWPPSSNLPVTISPEMESALPQSDLPKGSLRLRLVWLAPFDELQPIVISPDDLLARDQMRLIGQESHDDCERAYNRAATEAREWVSEGQASVKEAWLEPIILEEEELGVSIAIERRYKLSSGSLEQAYERARERLNAPTPVRRAWGVPGLMWALMLDRLSSARPFCKCESCGRLNSGRGHKRFCSAEEKRHRPDMATLKNQGLEGLG